jgi:hypothetical protein
VPVVVVAVTMLVQDILDMLEEQLQVEIFQLWPDKLLLFQLVAVVVAGLAAVVSPVARVAQARWDILVDVAETLVV